MRLISIDVGLRNLAWCVMSRETSEEERWQVPPFRGNRVDIINWKVVDIVENAGQKDVNLNKTDIATIVPWFMKCLEENTDILAEGIDLALIENQPSGHCIVGGVSISNVKTKVLSHVLQAFFLARKIPVKFVSPANKLKDAGEFMTDASVYSQHKKAAIALTEQCMAVMGDGFVKQWKAFKGKKDDLADAFLQGLCSSLEPVKPKSKSTKRRRTPLNLPVFDD
jgi:hypothetical protein